MAKDTYHEAVIHALEKDGWTITHDLYKFTTGDASFEIDLLLKNCLLLKKAMKKSLLK